MSIMYVWIATVNPAHAQHNWEEDNSYQYGYSEKGRERGETLKPDYYDTAGAKQ